MSLILEWLAASPIASALRVVPGLYVAASAAHILSIAILVGAILPLDLRMLGFFRSVSLAEIGPLLARFAAAGAVSAIVTGIVLFCARPIEYAANPAFLVKLGLLGVGLANAVLFTRTVRWQVLAATAPIPARARASAALSIVVWIAAILAGRSIGFV